MSIPTYNPAFPELDSHSDSDWLDIASTDKESDDNESIYSSRETDHEDPSRSRSRRSSLSYGSSRDGDVDAWEGLIDDSADEGMPNDVLAPNPHVPALSHRLATLDSDPSQDTSLDELRVKEGLDQSMVNTLSSSRSSSLHASTLHTSSRDLRLSFPDPITSSCRELLSTSYEEIRRNSDVLSSPNDSVGPSNRRQVDDEETLPSTLQTISEPRATAVPSLSGPELKVFLYGLSTIFKWSIVNRLLGKVAHGAGLTISPDLDSLEGPIRQLTVSGSFERDRAFPRVISVLDRTLQHYDTADDAQPAFIDFSGVRPLAVIFVPCHPLRLPDHVLQLPVLVLPPYSREVPDLSIAEAGSPQGTWSMLNISHRQILRITVSEDSPVVDKDSIDMIDSTRAHRAFSRLWSSDNNTSSMGTTTGVHPLTIIAILSLVLGLVVRAAFTTSLQQFTSPTLATLSPNYSSSFFWQMLRPAPHRERLPSSSILDSSVVVISSSFKETSMSVFSAESTSMTISRAKPINSRRVVPSTLSERQMLSQDLMLQPPLSVLVPDNRPKALSVIPENSATTYHLAPTTTEHAVSALIHTSIPGVKECTSAVLAVVNHDWQDIFDALDALVQAISRQTQIILTQATTFIEQSVIHLEEKSMESLETIKETFNVRHDRARKRAKEIKERGTKWLYGASGVVTSGAQFSKGVAWEMAEGLAHRAQHARGKAKEMATEIQDFLNEHDRFEVLGAGAWEVHAKHWDEWVKRVGKQVKRGRSCKPSTR